jgi:hypothetical protein
MLTAKPVVRSISGIGLLVSLGYTFGPAGSLAGGVAASLAADDHIMSG